MIGRNLIDGEFDFEVYLDDELYTLGHNNADGIVSFEKDIEFTAAGTYSITVKETNNNIENVTYDNNVFEYSIKVIDTGIGQLLIDVENSNIPEGVTFVNKYTPPTPPEKKQTIKEKEVVNPRTIDDINDYSIMAVASMICLCVSIVLAGAIKNRTRRV